MLRRAIVVPVLPEVGALVNEIRERFDPVMAARIDPHITLVHEVVDHDRADELVAAVAARAPFTVQLTRAELWGPARYGIFLDVDDPDGVLGALYAALRDVETPGWARVEYRPHVTLVHGRTVTEQDGRAGVGGARRVRRRLAGRGRLDRRDRARRAPMGTGPASCADMTR